MPDITLPTAITLNTEQRSGQKITPSVLMPKTGNGENVILLSQQLTSPNPDKRIPRLKKHNDSAGQKRLKHALCSTMLFVTGNSADFHVKSAEIPKAKRTMKITQKHSMFTGSVTNITKYFKPKSDKKAKEENGETTTGGEDPW
jgi:hypothetical protein